MEVTWPQIGTWAGAACSALALLAWWLVKKHTRKVELRARLRAREADLLVAEEEYDHAAKNGTATDMRRTAAAVSDASRECDAIRKMLHATIVLAGVSALAGCAAGQAERIVVLDDHVRLVPPGAVVPEYPEGESRWWLVSPTGLREIMPKYRQEEF